MLMLRAILSLSVSATLYGQSAIAPQFEVASIKPSKADSGSSSGIRTGHGRIDAENVTLKRCIIGAYGVGPHQIYGGPDWLDSDRFEILAKADQPVNGVAELMIMLRDLLADRFKLVLHSETRTMSAFVLEVAKNGPKLQAAEPGAARTNTSSNNGSVRIDARNTDMDSFARILARILDLPVVNRTELKGNFNVNLEWISENARAGKDGAPEGVSIFTAIQEQLGLRLRSEKTPLEVLVVDHAEKPSEN